MDADALSDYFVIRFPGISQEGAGKHRMNVNMTPFARLLLAAPLALALSLAASPGAFAQSQEVEDRFRVVGSYGDWRIICETPAGASSEQCGMHQSVQDEDREELGLSITYLRPADRQGDLLRIQAPLGVLLPMGIGLDVDGQNIGTAYFIRCFTDGCWADISVDETLLDVFKTGQRALFKLFQTPEEGIGIPVKLDGFSDAYDALS